MYRFAGLLYDRYYDGLSIAIRPLSTATTATDGGSSAQEDSLLRVFSLYPTLAVDAGDILTAIAGTSASCGRMDPAVESLREKGANTMADVHVYVNRPADKESAGLEDLEEALKKLEHVSDVDVNSPGNVVAVSFEGGRAEREEIERTVEEAGYEISRLSVRTTFGEE
jgi:copper chaperone CopZ